MINFLTSLSLIIGSWIHYFNMVDVSPSISRYTQVDQFHVVGKDRFYVYRVTFTTVNEAQGDGGAIYMTTGNLLIESSSFVLCHAKGKGGAIFYDDRTGKCYLDKICSANSYSSSTTNHFCNIYTQNANGCTTSTEHSSICHLKSQTIYQTNIEFHNSDEIALKYDNISDNACSHCSATGCDPTSKTTVLYTAYENNTCTEYSQIYFINNAVVNIDNCNIIAKADTKTAMFWLNGIITISNSYLYEDASKKMFDFMGEGNICTIINCTIENTAYKGNVDFKIDSNNTPDKPFINVFDNDGCFAESEQVSRCTTFIMRGKRFNTKKDNYILSIV